MKSISNQIQEIQDEFVERSNWMSLAASMMGFAVKNGMSEELKKEFEKHMAKLDN